MKIDHDFKPLTKAQVCAWAKRMERLAKKELRKLDKFEAESKQTNVHGIKFT